MAVQLTDEQTAVTVDGQELVRLARFVLAERRIPPDMDVGILLVDVSTITGLNAAHMDKDGPTDVLAFPIDEPGTTPPGIPAVLGDIVLCPEVAHGQAAEFGRSGPDEVRLLVVHGLLHLMGMDHDSPSAELEMFGLTDRLLAGFRDRDAGQAGP